MIAAQTPVQVSRSGTMALAEELSIGDLVYDVLTDSYVELVDIRSRQCSPSDTRLTRIEAGRFGTGRPRKDMTVSRHQLLMRPSAKGTPGEFGCVIMAAHQFGADVIMPVTLFVLVPERPAVILADGVALYLMDRALLRG